MLVAAIDHGREALARLTRGALRRQLAGGNVDVGRLFTPEEEAELAGVLAAVLGTADLTGRALLRDLASRLRQHFGESVLREGAGAPIPFRRQDTGHNCGAALLQAVAALHGIDVPEADLARLMGTDPEDGTRPSEMLAGCARLHLPAEERHDSTVEDLDYVTRQGVPVMCCVQMHNGGHWVGVRQVTPAGVEIMNPVEGVRVIPRGEWERIWFDRDADNKDFVRYAIAVGPPAGPARESRLHEALGVPVEPLPPEDALRYFLDLVPKLGIDPERWGTDLRRHAFQLAASTSEELTARVQAVIAAVLRSGQGISTAPAAIDALLDAAGVGGRQAGYSEMLVRTNCMDAFGQGLQDELSQSKDTFPVWKYSNPCDSRSRPHHAARNGKYFPSSVLFVKVRGEGIEDAANDRCLQIPVSRWEWADLRAGGARIADGYADPFAG